MISVWSRISYDLLYTGYSKGRPEVTHLFWKVDVRTKYIWEDVYAIYFNYTKEMLAGISNEQFLGKKKKNKLSNFKN